MVVKGDGSLVRAEIALQRPVETVISGPAASVIGACHLSRSHTAIIADMGGTTTDIAIVTDGQPDISDQAALIGDWRPMVETIRVLSVGLGGDSEARFKGGQGSCPWATTSHSHEFTRPPISKRYLRTWKHSCRRRLRLGAIGLHCSYMLTRAN